MSYSNFWAVIDKIGIPYLATRAERGAIKALYTHLEKFDQGPFDLLDLGCGDGRLSVAAATENTRCIYLVDDPSATSIALRRLSSDFPELKIKTKEQSVLEQSAKIVDNGIVFCAGVLSLYPRKEQEILIRLIVSNNPLAILVTVPGYGLLGRCYVWLNFFRGSLSVRVANIILLFINKLPNKIISLSVVKKFIRISTSLIEPFLMTRIYSVREYEYESAFEKFNYRLIYKVDAKWGRSFVFIKNLEEGKR
jgi:hypothetical protein